MAHIQDVRRVNTLVIVVGALAAMWLLFLWLHDHEHFEWFLPRSGLNGLTYGTWVWVVVGVLATLVIVSGMLVYAIPVAKDSGRAIGSVRQVQCQHCRAVFRMTDTGIRPLTHICPRCKSFGVYDGTVPPVGVPEEVDPAAAKQLKLTCKSCEHHFEATDTGVRPLTIACPACDAKGALR